MCNVTNMKAYLKMKIFLIEFLSSCFNPLSGIIAVAPYSKLTNHVGRSLSRVALVARDIFDGFISFIPSVFGKQTQSFISCHACHKNTNDGVTKTTFQYCLPLLCRLVKVFPTRTELTSKQEEVISFLDQARFASS